MRDAYKIFKNIYALAISANPQSLPAGCSVPHAHSNDEHSPCARLHSSHDVLHPMDSLKAYYSFIALKHWTDKAERKQLKKSANDSHNTSRLSMNSSPSSLHSSPKSSPVKRGLDVNAPAFVSKSADCLSLASRSLDFSDVTNSPPEVVIREIAQNLLWDTVAKKLSIEECLSEIRTAMDNLGSVTPAADDGSCEPAVCDQTAGDGVSDDSNAKLHTSSTPHRLQTPAAHLHKTRRASGDHLPMDGARRRERPHEALLSTPRRELLSRLAEHSDHEEYVTADAGHEDSQPAADALMPESQHHGGEDSVANSGSAHSDTENSQDRGGHSELTATRETDLDSIEIELEQNQRPESASSNDSSTKSAVPGDTIGGVVKDSAETSASVPARPYSGVPAEWYRLPAQQRYRHDCVTRALLAAEQQRLTKQLDDMHPSFKVGAI